MVRSHEVDEFGEPLKYDPTFRGPLKNRSCTDILCLLLFSAFIVAWVALGIFAIKNGDPEILLVPRDSNGRRCGMDGLEDKPYLFFHDLTKCLGAEVPFTGCKTPQVCVSKCPDQVYVANSNKPYDGDSSYCVTQGLITVCPDWYLPSESVLKRCLYNVAQRNTHHLGSDSVKIDEITLFRKELEPIKMWATMAVQNGIAIFSHDPKVQKVGQEIVKDIINSWWKILIGVGAAVLICLLYIFMLRFIAGIMVWISIFGIIALLSAGVYVTQNEYRKFSNSTEETKTKKDLWLAALIILSIILGIILLVIIFLRKRITLAIALIKEGSKAVSSVTSVLFFPIFPWILQLGVIAYAIVVCLYLATTGKPQYHIQNCRTDLDDTECFPKNFTNELCTSNGTCKFIGTTETTYYKYAQVFNLFGLFWLAFFVSALGQMILAGVFAQWYWTFKKSTLPFFAVTEAILRTLRYHVGTLAFGSLIIAICRMIRVALEYIDHKLKKYDNEITKAILCCLKCFFWCLEKFLKFINKNAYIMCAIHGKNFCGSAKDAFLLLMRNILRVFVLDKVTDFLFFLSKLLISFGVGSIAYICFATDLTSIDNSNIKYGLVPVVIIMLITYLITSIFFNVYSMAVDTLFLCFLEDSERNDGSNEKPYYMSKNLMKIFGKKNKTS